MVTINYSEGVRRVRMAFHGVDGIRQILTWSFFTAVFTVDPVERHVNLEL